MLALLMTLTCLAQAAQAPTDLGASSAVGTVSSQASGVVVRGTVELSVGEADAAAEAMVADRARDLLAEQGRSLLASASPFWFPHFSRQQVLQSWLAGIDGRDAVRVVGREQQRHDHGALGTSYRTELVVQPDRHRVSDLLSKLRRQIPRSAHAFALKCAGILVYWLLLAGVVAWLDRLSRGYMTWRLRFIGLIAGSVLPVLLLILV